jgi:hypothetical protein
MAGGVIISENGVKQRNLGERKLAENGSGANSIMAYQSAA